MKSKNLPLEELNKAKQLAYINFYRKLVESNMTDEQIRDFLNIVTITEELTSKIPGEVQLSLKVELKGGN